MRQTPQVWLPRWDDRPAGLLSVLKGRNQDYHHPEISEGCGVSLSRVKCQSLGVQMSGLGHQKWGFGDFPGGPVAENLPASAGNMGRIPGLGRSHRL